MISIKKLFIIITLMLAANNAQAYYDEAQFKDEITAILHYKDELDAQHNKTAHDAARYLKKVTDNNDESFNSNDIIALTKIIQSNYQSYDQTIAKILIMQTKQAKKAKKQIKFKAEQQKELDRYRRKQELNNQIAENERSRKYYAQKLKEVICATAIISTGAFIDGCNIYHDIKEWIQRNRNTLLNDVQQMINTSINAKTTTAQSTYDKNTPSKWVDYAQMI